jgi:hypothetical protein
MNFSGSTARLVQPVEHKLSRVSWKEFGFIIRERFGKDQQEFLLRQLLHIRQISIVYAYV